MATGQKRRSTGRRSRAWLALAGTGLLIASACGTRWDDDQTAEFLERTSAGNGTSPSAGEGVPDETETGAGSGPAVALPDGQVPAGEPGGVAVTPDPGASSGPRPCAARSNAPGVTDDQVTIGNIGTLTGPVPGLGSSSAAAVRAYAEFRNGTGGICGRRIELRAGDDGADSGRFRSLVTEFDPKVLALVNGIAGGDAGGRIVAERKIPYVGLIVTPALYKEPTIFGVSPPYRDLNAKVGKFEYLYSQGVRTAALVYFGVDQVRAEVGNKHRPKLIASGVKIIQEQELPLSTLSYDSAARAVANAKPDYLLFVGAWDQGASMARSMNETGYRPKFAEYVSSYGSPFIEAAGAAAEGTMSWTQTLPNEEPNTVPEQTHFLEWMAQTAPDQPTDRFAAEAWAAAKAFFDALEALPGTISREAIVRQLTATEHYDAGGLMGPMEFGQKHTNGCAIGMIVKDGKWQRLAPAKGFLC